MASNAEAGLAGEHRTRSTIFGTIRGRLFLLTLSLLIPALLLTAILLWRAYVQEHQAGERQLSDNARALSLVVDRQIGQSQVLLNALATSPYLRAWDLRTFDAQVRAANPGGSHWILVLDESGQQRVNTSMPFGARLPSVRSVQRRQDFRMVGDGVRLWDVVRDPVSRQDVVVLARSIPLDKGGSARLAVITPAGSFFRLFAEQKLPTRWVADIIDAGDHIVARNRKHEEYVGRRVSPLLRQLMHTSPQGTAPTTTLDGVPSITAWNRSSLTGWTFVVAVPKGELAAGARASLRAAAAIGLILLGAGVIMSILVGRGVSQPIERLAAQATALGRGEDPPPIQSRLAEVDAVQDALRGAAAELLRRERDLQALNQTLETRVSERTRELAEATDSLVQAQKMEAVGRLTGGIAHDFNNLLTAVLGNIDLVERRNEDPRTARQLGAARQAAERGAKLTGQLLAFSRRQHLRTEPVDVNAAIENTVGLLRSTLGGAITVEHSLGASLWRASADPTQLDLILLNLAINARDAMPTGGSIAITTANVTRGTASTPEEPGPGDYVAIAVADRGTGMSPEVLARVFEPFFTTKPIGQGTGLGLPQVLGVLKQLGGGVRIDTKSGEGTTVTIFLPRAGAAEEAGVAAGELPHADLRGLRLLLCDDDPDVRGVTAAMLREIGCHVAEQSAGSAALDQLRGGDHFDFLLLDYAMPGLNGAEVAARARELDPALPILLMSGFADVDALTRIWSGPLLSKPFTARGLEAAIAEVAKSHRVVRLRSA